MSRNQEKALWTKQIGRQAEDAVLSEFLSRGYSLLARNYNVNRYGELDLVLHQGMCIYIVEVKSRKDTNTYGGTEESITRQKLLRMTCAARVFLQDRKWEMYDVRFIAGFVTHSAGGLIQKVEILPI